MIGNVDVERMLQCPQDPNQLGTTEYAFGEFEILEAPLACACCSKPGLIRSCIEASVLLSKVPVATATQASSNRCWSTGQTRTMSTSCMTRGRALDCACKIQRLDVVQALLEAGAERNAAMDITPLICASGRGKQSNVSYSQPPFTKQRSWGLR